MVLVTGAAGRLGSRVIRLHLDQGYEVCGTDRVAPETSPSPFVETDLCDASRVEELFEDVEAIIHLGAIPGPLANEPATIFENNAQSIFNVFNAASERKLRRVAFSSSAFSRGWAPDPSAFVPHYLPLDEEHPSWPFEPYGLSKQIGESIGEMVARNTSTTVASLRFTNVVPP